MKLKTIALSILTLTAFLASLFMAAPLLAMEHSSEGMTKESQGEKSAAAGEKTEELVTLNQDEIRKMQKTLNEKGFDVGTPDGLMGPRTKEALIQFQRSEGLAATGKVDQKTMQALRQGQESSDMIGQTGDAGTSGTTEPGMNEPGTTGTGTTETYGAGPDWPTDSETGSESQSIEQLMKEQPIEKEQLKPRSLAPSLQDEGENPDKEWMHQQQQ